MPITDKTPGGALSAQTRFNLLPLPPSLHLHRNAVQRERAARPPCPAPGHCRPPERCPPPGAPPGATAQRGSQRDLQGKGRCTCGWRRRAAAGAAGAQILQSPLARPCLGLCPLRTFWVPRCPPLKRGLRCSTAAAAPPPPACRHPARLSPPTPAHLPAPAPRPPAGDFPVPRGRGEDD